MASVWVEEKIQREACGLYCSVGLSQLEKAVWKISKNVPEALLTAVQKVILEKFSSQVKLWAAGSERNWMAASSERFIWTWYSRTMQNTSLKLFLVSASSQARILILNSQSFSCKQKWLKYNYTFFLKKAPKSSLPHLRAKKPAKQLQSHFPGLSGPDLRPAGAPNTRTHLTHTPPALLYKSGTLKSTFSCQSYLWPGHQHLKGSLGS